MFQHSRVPMKINPTHNMDPPYPNSTPHPVTFEIFLLFFCYCEIHGLSSKHFFYCDFRGLAFFYSHSQGEPINNHSFVTSRVVSGQRTIVDFGNKHAV